MSALPEFDYDANGAKYIAVKQSRRMTRVITVLRSPINKPASSRCDRAALQRGTGSGSGGNTSGLTSGSGSGLGSGTTSGVDPGPGSGSGFGSGSMSGTGGGELLRLRDNFGPLPLINVALPKIAIAVQHQQKLFAGVGCVKVSAVCRA